MHKGKVIFKFHGWVKNNVSYNPYQYIEKKYL